MDELLFEYHYDKSRRRVCLNCKHYYKAMKAYDAVLIMQANEIKEKRYGQKYCIKNKSFVFLSDACGQFEFRDVIVWS